VFNVTNSVRFDRAALPQTTSQLEQPREIWVRTVVH
jgi:hypothetical protein